MTRLHDHCGRDLVLPEGAHLMPWHFITDADHLLDYREHEDHQYGVWITGDFWCCGCVSRPPRYFTQDGHPGWPSMDHAPNGLIVAIAHQDDIAPDRRIVRRPLCPLDNGHAIAPEEPDQNGSTPPPGEQT